MKHYKTVLFEFFNFVFQHTIYILNLRRKIKRVMMGNTVNEYGHLNLAFPTANPLSIMSTCDLVVPKNFYSRWRQIRQACRRNYALFAGLHQRMYSRTNFSYWTRLQTSMFQVNFIFIWFMTFNNLNCGFRTTNFCFPC